MSDAVLRAAHTHLYPGARLEVDGALTPGAGLTIVFADLGSADARVEGVDAGRVALAVAGHRTARGTAIAAKRWLLAPGPAGPMMSTTTAPAPRSTWRVARRLADPAR